MPSDGPLLLDDLLYLDKSTSPWWYETCRGCDPRHPGYGWCRACDADDPDDDGEGHDCVCECGPALFLPYSSRPGRCPVCSIPADEETGQPCPCVAVEGYLAALHHPGQAAPPLPAGSRLAVDPTSAAQAAKAGMQPDHTGAALAALLETAAVLLERCRDLAGPVRVTCQPAAGGVLVEPASGCPSHAAEEALERVIAVVNGQPTVRAGVWCTVGELDGTPVRVQWNGKGHLGASGRFLNAGRQAERLRAAVPWAAGLGGVAGFWMEGLVTSCRAGIVGSYATMAAVLDMLPASPRTGAGGDDVELERRQFGHRVLPGGIPVVVWHDPAEQIGEAGWAYDVAAARAVLSARRGTESVVLDRWLRCLHDEVLTDRHLPAMKIPLPDGETWQVGGYPSDLQDVRRLHDLLFCAAQTARAPGDGTRAGAEPTSVVGAGRESVAARLLRQWACGDLAETHPDVEDW